VVTLGLGALLLWTSIPKITAPAAFLTSIYGYELLTPVPATMIAIVLPWVEFLLSICLIGGACRCLALTICALMFAVFGIAQASVLYRGLSVQCGCGLGFGDDHVSIVTLCRSFVLMACASFALCCSYRVSGTAPFGACSGMFRLCFRPPKRACSIILALAILVCTGFTPCVSARDAEAVRRIRQQACAEYQSDYDRILSQYSKDKDVQAFQRKVVLLDDIVATVFRNLSSHRASYLNRKAALAGETAGESAGHTISALTLLTRNSAAFKNDLALAALSSADQKVMQAYYAASVKGLNEAVWEEARTTTYGNAAEVRRLSLVIPLLSCADEGWSERSIANLPSWLREKEVLSVLEEFAFAARYPRTAYACSQCLGPHRRPSPEGYLDCLEQGADLMLRNREYPTGLYYLKLALEAALSTNSKERSISLRLRIAELMHDTGSPKEAIDLLRQILTDAAQDCHYAKAATLRLRYLFEEHAFEQVVAEAIERVQDERCRECLPELLYIDWVANRRLLRFDEASELQKSFFEKFPAHPLGAELYYAAAMGLLARCQYTDALRVLRFIRHQYPESPFLPEVKRWEQRLIKSIPVESNSLTLSKGTAP
jgi:hypothetical protein